MKQTAHKAHAAAGATLVTFLLAQWGLGEAPSAADLTTAFKDLGMALGAAVASWLATYYKRNHDKE